MTNKTTLRVCVCCKQMYDKKELYRIVNDNGNILFDKTRKSNGRGAYVCKNCVSASKLKKPFLSRALKAEITEDNFKNIMEGILNCL